MPSVRPAPVPSTRAEHQPPRLNLENQRKQARSLLNAARAGDARALRRLAALHPRQPKATTAAAKPRWSLHHAQLVIARERGFKSWAKLKAHLEADNLSVRGALVGAVNRALEMDTDQPLFIDPLAKALAGKKGFALHQELRSTTWPPYAAGPAPEQSIVTRYYDDALQAAVQEHSLAQVVLLGAGMDARAFRLRWPANLVFFEVDDGAVFDLTQPRIASPNCFSCCVHLSGFRCLVEPGRAERPNPLRHGAATASGPSSGCRGSPCSCVAGDLADGVIPVAPQVAHRLRARTSLGLA